MRELSTIAVIGAGPLGRHLAFLAAQAGYRTILEDVMPANLRRAGEHFEYLEKKVGLKNGVRAVELASTLEEAVRTADLIIDCVPDELESKLEIFSLLDRMAPPRAILGTPTVSQSIADLASCTYRASQCVAFELNARSLQGDVAFPEVITVVKTSQTQPDVLDAVVRFWSTLGVQTNVRLDKAETSTTAVPNA